MKSLSTIRTRFWRNIFAASFAFVPCVAALSQDDGWEKVYQERLTWWSLQPVANPAIPPVQNKSWPRNEIDRFILTGLEAKGLASVVEADRHVLARRLSFALTGLPPKQEDVARFIADESPGAYERYVQTLLDSPQFGERWARHWMDVVHYSDTHGYEWDTPAKNAWMYRDYLIRAFNQDISFKRLIHEQIAGDLIEPRIDPETGLNESLIGPMSMRLGERRHGDNADAEGVTQEAMANIIDTVSKGYLATTVACAQCHDHKLDAVSQQDYFGLAGIFMSSRWISRSADTIDPNLAVLEKLRAIKHEIALEMGELWQGAEESLATNIFATPAEEPAKQDKAKPAAAETFPDSAVALWRYAQTATKNGSTRNEAWSKLASWYQTERDARAKDNAKNLTFVADFTGATIPDGWRIDGFGMQHGLVKDGALVVADEGGTAVSQLLIAGRWSHVWSSRLGGALRGPLLEQNKDVALSVGYAGGKHAAQSLVVENAFHSERMKFLDRAQPGWMTLTPANLPALAGGVDHTPRRLYLELVTKSLNNYFPPRAAYAGLKEADEKDPRSWFGVTRIYKHPVAGPPRDALPHFASLLEGTTPTSKEETARTIAKWILSSVDHWRNGDCTADDVRVINEALAAKWLPNDALASPKLAQLVAQYRDTEKKLQPERVIGSAEDWDEGRDERIGLRGSYTEFGDAAPRGNIRFLGGPAARANEHASGRLEFAEGIANDTNPLTARVFVNRVWTNLFGDGIVRTPDDFGHLGEAPSHPELLDWLALRFMEDDWSLKKLVTLIVTSATWRQSCVPNDAAMMQDPENRLWHHMPMRRLDAESIRDAMLAASGRLDDTMYGPPVEPNRVAEDAAKRLFSGPVDSNGRRSIYIKMTMMEPQRFLAQFNQPIPKLCTGKRDATNVPNQALALLNDPFVSAMARGWADRLVADGATAPEHRAQEIFEAAFGRAPDDAEVDRVMKLAARCAELRGADTHAMMTCQPVWQDVAHAIFNAKEFIYVQ